MNFMELYITRTLITGAILILIRISFAGVLNRLKQELKDANVNDDSNVMFSYFQKFLLSLVFCMIPVIRWIWVLIILLYSCVCTNTSFRKWLIDQLLEQQREGDMEDPHID